MTKNYNNKHVRQVKHVRQAETRGELLAVDCSECHTIHSEVNKISATNCALEFLWSAVATGEPGRTTGTIERST